MQLRWGRLQGFLFPNRLIFCFGLVVHLAGSTTTTIEPGCLAGLRQAVNAESFESAAKSAYEAARSSEPTRMAVIVEAVNHGGFRSWRTTAQVDEFLLRFIDSVGASQQFYRDLVLFLERDPDARFATLARGVKRNLLPEVLPDPSTFRSAFSSVLREDAATLTVFKYLFGEPRILSTKNITRKVFAYLANFTELSADEKYDFTINAFNFYNREGVLRKNGNGKPVLLFYPQFDSAPDGTRFICSSTTCSVFFAYTPDSKVVFVRNYNPFNRKKWRKGAEVIREAGEP